MQIRTRHARLAIIILISTNSKVRSAMPGEHCTGAPLPNWEWLNLYLFLFMSRCLLGFSLGPRYELVLLVLTLCIFLSLSFRRRTFVSAQWDFYDLQFCLMWHSRPGGCRAVGAGGAGGAVAESRPASRQAWTRSHTPANLKRSVEAESRPGLEAGLDSLTHAR